VASDETGQALAGAVRTHTLTSDEIHLVAIWWAYMAMARQRGEIDPTFFRADINGRVANLARQWPALFPARRTGQVAQAVIGSPADFACGTSCAPSRQALNSTAHEVLNHTLDAMIKGTAYGHVYRLFRQVKDGIDAGAAAGMSAGDALAMALRNPNGTVDARTILLTAGYAVSAAGAVAGAAVVLGVAGPTVGAIASVGATVSAVLTGIEIVSDLGSAAELSLQCLAWRNTNCMDMPEPDPDRGVPVPPPPADDPFEPIPPAQPTDPIPPPPEPCAPLVDRDAGCVPRPDHCPNGSIVCSCPEEHGTWCHPPACGPGGPPSYCGGSC
jgi:hypothetical protein